MTDVTNIGSLAAARSVRPPTGRSAGSATPSQSLALVQHQSLSKAGFQSLAEEVQREQLTQVEPPTRNENHVKSEHNEQLNEQLNEAMAEFNRSVNFRVDQDTGITVLTVRDRATQEVIRQIPPDEFLTLVLRLDEMRGIFFEEMA